MANAKTTAIASALADAGYEDALDRLAREAWEKWPFDFDGGHRRDYLRTALQREATWTLMLRWQPSALVQAVGWLLNEAKPAAIQNAGHKPAGGGHPRCDTQGQGASATPSREAAQPQAARRSEPAEGRTAPIRDLPARSPLSVVAEKFPDDIASRSSVLGARLEVQLRVSRLDSFRVDGRPIGDFTAAEGTAAAARRMSDSRASKRDALFILSLVSNVPSYGVIREWNKDQDEIDAAYQRAEAESAA